MNCREIQNLEQSYLDGELSRRKRHGIESHLKKCDSCRIRIDAEGAVLNGLRDFPEIPCPENVVRRIRMETGIEVKEIQATVTERLKGFFSFGHIRPLAIGLAVATIVLVMVFSESWKSGNGKDAYSETDILEAQKQAKWTLAYVAHKIDRTERDILEEVILKELPSQIQTTLRQTIPFLKGEQP